MVKIKITRATVAGGKRIETGQTVETSEADARQLIALGKAVPVAMAQGQPENRDNAHAAATNKRTVKKKSNTKDD